MDKQTVTKMHSNILLSCYDTASYRARSTTDDKATQDFMVIKNEILRRLNVYEKLYGLLEVKL